MIRVHDIDTLCFHKPLIEKIYFSCKMFDQIHFYKKKFFKKTYFDFKNGWTVANVRVHKGKKFHQSDESYPRRYYFNKDGESDPTLLALHANPGESILIFERPDIWDHEIYDDTYLGKIKPRNVSTFFNVYDYGLSGAEINIVPNGLAHRRHKVMLLNYEKQIFSTKPSVFEVDLMDSKYNSAFKLESMHPIWNNKTNMYELDFFGTAKITSSKNLILCEKGYTAFENQDTSDSPNGKKLLQLNDNIHFLQGKRTKTEFNVHYRDPLSDYQAFCISLTAMYKKSFA